MSKIKNTVAVRLKQRAAEIAVKKQELAEVESKLNPLIADKQKGFKIDSVLEHELTMKNSSLKRQIADSIVAAKAEAEKAYDEAIEELKISDMPKAEDMTEDAGLLKSGVRLREDELLNLMRKDSNRNTTMHRLFMDYAKENKLTIPADDAAYIGVQNDIDTLESERHAVAYCCRWLDRDDSEKMIDRMLGDDEVETW